MNFVLKILIEHKLVGISDSLLDRWEEKGEINNLIFAAKNGNYKVRLRTVNILSAHLSEERVVDQLLELVCDDVTDVSKEAIDVLKSHSDFDVHKRLAHRILYRRKMLKMRRGAIGITSQNDPVYTRQSTSQKWSSKLRENQSINNPLMVDLEYKIFVIKLY